MILVPKVFTPNNTLPSLRIIYMRVFAAVITTTFFEGYLESVVLVAY